ncbi:MAG: phosphatidylglycerol lysyltransferase domain-containing protein [Phascolarctobacterium sp.]|nr:phosphatidylglycerol lysyltransferase domain-containing protein [Phascolarctobacterium sp.]
MLEFSEVTLKQKDLFEKYLSKPCQRGSECAFSNHFMWRDCYHICWCIARNFLLIKVNRNNVDFFLQPFGGRDEDLPLLINDIREIHEGIPFEMHGIYEYTKERMEKVMPWIEFIEDRDTSDYVYLRENLATLVGRKYHGQKNHYNTFKKNYPDYVYEPITESNMAECRSFGEKWCDDRLHEDTSIICEKYAIQQAFHNFVALELRGGAIRLDGKIEAFSFGRKINEDTAVEHVEKANPEIRGLYAVINKEFAAHAWGDVVYLNREEDMGHEGLRRVKESYHPEFILKKYNAVFR